MPAAHVMGLNSRKRLQGACCFPMDRTSYVKQVADLRAYAVEPAGAAVLAGHPVTDPRHRLQGAGYARADLPLFDRGLATAVMAAI